VCDMWVMNSDIKRIELCEMRHEAMLLNKLRIQRM
jgi:hypothetical protein